MIFRTESIYFENVAFHFGSAISDFQSHSQHINIIYMNFLSDGNYFKHLSAIIHSFESRATQIGNSIANSKKICMISSMVFYNVTVDI